MFPTFSLVRFLLQHTFLSVQPWTEYSTRCCGLHWRTIVTVHRAVHYGRHRVLLWAPGPFTAGELVLYCFDCLHRRPLRCTFTEAWFIGANYIYERAASQCYPKPQHMPNLSTQMCQTSSSKASNGAQDPSCPPQYRLHPQFPSIPS